VVELSPSGEAKIDDGTLDRTLRADLGLEPDFPIFIPAATYPKGKQKVTIHLMEGYVFIGTGLDDIHYFRLESRPYVNKVITTQSNKNSMRLLSVVPDDKIEELKEKLREMVSCDLEDGSFVKVLDGTYKGLEGKILGFWDDTAFILIELRSITVIATIPKILLDPQD